MNGLSDFKCIQIRELPTWIKVLKQDSDIITKEDMLDELELIDDLLSIQRSKSLMLRKTKLSFLLEARIAKKLEHKNPLKLKKFNT